MTSQPALILVVGMHRSGTSLLGSILQAIGIATPGELIAGDPHNPEGYFERRDITDLQEQLLIDLGRWWPSAEGELDLPADWLIRPQTRQFCQQLAAILRQERDQQCQPWAIKDPRTSLLLPLWRRVCGELAIPLKLLLAVRDPAEVAASLCRRDAEAAGMTPERAERLWWRHHQAVLRHSRDLPLEVIDYGRWFGAPAEAEEQLQRLARFCGLNGEDAALLEAGLAPIRPELRRSSSVPLAEGSTAQACYRRLQQSCTAANLIELPKVPAPISRRRRWLKRLKGGSAARTREQLYSLIEPWFDERYYRSRHPDLQDHPAPLLDYLKDGWLGARRPHPLFDAAHYLQRCQERGFSPAAGASPLEHFLRCGAAHQIPCTPLLQPGWFFGRGQRLQPERPPALAELHPWGAAALTLADGDLAAAAALLEHWLVAGLPDEDLNCIAQVEAPWLRWSQPEPPAPARTAGPGVAITLDPVDHPDHWRTQGWRAACHGPAAAMVLRQAGSWPPAACLQELAPAAIAGTTLRDPDPVRCKAWQRLGLAAELLRPPTDKQLEEWLPVDPWLKQAGRQLGLPDPRSLAADTVICLGAGSPDWNLSSHPRIWQLPGFDHLLLSNPDDHRALAAWLFHLGQQGVRLVRLHPDRSELEWSSWLPIEVVQPFALNAQALLEELAWRDAGRPDPGPITTPKPDVRLLWQWQQEGQHPEAAVVISLYNYGDRIQRALESVAAQSLTALELIVVDDASGDDGAQVVQEWLQQHGRRFLRVLLLQHQHNGGLAAARNSAFRHARAPWCFVLDADNELDPTAVETCLGFTHPGDPRRAVVHPLIRRLSEPQAGTPAIPPDLVSRLSWQQAHFAQEGNGVDAMALIRRSAWEDVGGFHDIPGGWEDFDFWCCLIDAGYHGVLCPRPLATYTVHATSMLQSTTNQNLRRLSRLLQHRHPWLHLPLALADH